MSIESIKITNDVEAFAALGKAIGNEIGPETIVEFDGWPVFKLTISGKNFHGSIPTRIMPPILELQKEIHRIYSRARYNTDDTRNLKQEERDQLELVVEIKEGSTEFITELAKSLNEIVKSTNMSSQEALLLLVSIAAMMTGAFAWKDWLRSKERIHGEDVTVQLSQEETRRLELVTAAMTRHPEIAQNKAAIDGFRDDLSRRLKPEDEIKVDFQPIITGNRASEIVPALRTPSEEIRIDGEFVINEVKFPSSFGGKYRFAATRLTDGQHLMIDAHPDILSSEQIQILRDSSFSVRRVFMKVNAKKVRDAISAANLVAISWPRPGDTEES